MAFDSKAFLRAEFVSREERIPVPALKAFFGDDEPVFVVRGLTADEINRAQEATKRSKDTDDILQALIADNPEKLSELREALGISSNDRPAEVVRRLEILTQGIVEPALDMPMAIKFATAFPIDFYSITTKILELTGLGMDLKKSKPSGKTATLET